MAVFVVGAAIVDSLTNPTQLLAAQRSYPEALAGQWEFPGGKVEPGEVPEEALHREIREELGAALILGPRILAPATGLASITTSAGTSGDWSIPVGRMRVWLAEISPESPAPSARSSHRELRWVPRDSIATIPWLTGDLQIIPKLLAWFS